MRETGAAGWALRPRHRKLPSLTRDWMPRPSRNCELVYIFSFDRKLQWLKINDKIKQWLICEWWMWVFVSRYPIKLDYDFNQRLWQRPLFYSFKSSEWFGPIINPTEFLECLHEKYSSNWCNSSQVRRWQRNECFLVFPEQCQQLAAQDQHHNRRQIVATNSFLVCFLEWPY